MRDKAAKAKKVAADRTENNLFFLLLEQCD